MYENHKGNLYFKSPPLHDYWVKNKNPMLTAIIESCLDNDKESTMAVSMGFLGFTNSHAVVQSQNMVLLVIFKHKPTSVISVKTII